MKYNDTYNIKTSVCTLIYRNNLQTIIHSCQTLPLPVHLRTKVLTILREAYPWSIGTKWPALLTVFSYRQPASFLYPEVFVPVFHTENNVSLNKCIYIPELFSIFVMNSLDPLECARSLNNQIILPIVNKNVSFSAQ